jgi:uncharacterized protein (TIGR00251 family)
VAETPFRLAEGRLLVALKVQPGAGANALAGIETLADGRRVLKIRVTAPPEGGKANAAVIKLLAKTWKLPKGRLAIVAGQTARLKTLEIADADAALLRRLERAAASV